MSLAITSLLVLIGAAIQAFAVSLFTGHNPEAMGAVLLIVAGTLIGGGALAVAVSPRKPIPRVADLLLLGAVGLFLPALGLIGIGAAIAVRARSEFRRRDDSLIETELPSLPGSPLHSDQSARFGPGSLEGILRHSGDAETRLRVVLACRQLPGRLAVPLLRLALRDPVDDVRLLGYAVLEQRERHIQSEIQALLSRAGAADVRAAGLGIPARAKLAELYWELAYEGLVEGELLSFSLEQVLEHSRAVLAVSGEHPRMALLAGRAMLMRGEPDQARGLLHESLQRGLPVEVVGPYLAEAEYLDRRPADVRRYLAACAASARLRPGLAVMMERWT